MFVPIAPLAALAEIAPLIRDAAPQQERQRRLSAEVLEAIYDARLFKLWLPVDLGGCDLDLPAALDVFREASRIDGATGWAVTIGTGGNLFAGYLQPDVVAEMFGPREAVIAGSGSPSGRALAFDGGYEATGRWKYASGAHYATWFTANCILDEPGPAPETPRIRAMSFPSKVVQLHETWDAFGMSATSSIDFSVDHALVPQAYTFSVFSDAPILAAPIYRFPFQSVAELSFAAVALGVGRHTVEAFVQLAISRPMREPPGTLLAQPDTIARLSEAEVLLRSADAWFTAVSAKAWATFVETGELDAQLRSEVTLASTHAAQAAIRASDMLFAISGTSPVLSASDFGRAWRDLHVVSQHVMLSPSNYALTSPAFFGQPED